MNNEEDDDDERIRRRRALIAAFIPVLFQAAGEIIEAYRGFIIKLVQQQDRKRLVDGRSFATRKKKRTKFDHARVNDALADDYLGIVPRFRDAQFERTPPFVFRHYLEDYLEQNDQFQALWKDFLKCTEDPPSVCQGDPHCQSAKTNTTK